MTSGNILSLPFRRSTNLSLSTVVRQHINSKYDQHPDMFRTDLDAVDTWRKDAVAVREPHLSGVRKLQGYAAQLVWMGGKFPIDIGAEFTWYPALGYNADRPMSRNNVKYELLNVLWNLAALYSQLALNAPRSSAEGIKSAANFFSQAAGVLAHMQSVVLPELRMSDPPDDMDAHTLESLTQLMLAQSQECFWQKAVQDGYKDASIAKLAARVSDLYNLAGEAAVKSEAIPSAWIHHATAKHHHFAAAAQYRAACDCLEKRRYGEEVARLQDSVACVNEGLKETRSGYLVKTVVDDLNGLKRKVEEDLKRAERDNDMIFLNVVPPKSELKLLDRANMAVPRTPPQVASPYDFLGDQAEFGPGLFSRLVPFSVHVSISIYEERRDRMVSQNIIQQFETLAEKMHETMSSMGLPGSLQALEKPLGLPPGLVQHAEELRQADAVGRMRQSFADIDKLRNADLAVFEEGKQALAMEEEEDRQLRGRYGTERWTRPESRADAEGAKFWGHAAEVDGYFQSSISSDGLVREKYAAVEDLIILLTGTDRGLMDYVPSSRHKEVSEDIRPAVGKLRSAYNDALRLESRWRKKVEAVRTLSRRDDIKPDILKEAARLERTYPNTPLAPAHFEDLFEKRLDKMYEPEVIALEQESREQEAAILNVDRANQEFVAQKRRVGDKGHSEREAALQRLDQAYAKYKEVVSNLEVGRKFYNDLGKVVGPGFRDVVRQWVTQRRMEARALEEELNMPRLQNLDIHAQPRDAYQAQPTPRESYPPQPQPAAIQSWGSPEPIRHPQPVAPHPVPAAMSPGPGVWNPNAGIRFGAPQPPAKGSGTWDQNNGIRFG